MFRWTYRIMAGFLDRHGHVYADRGVFHHSMITCPSNTLLPESLVLVSSPTLYITLTYVCLVAGDKLNSGITNASGAVFAIIHPGPGAM